MGVAPTSHGIARAQNPAETTPPEHKRTDPQQTTPQRDHTPPLVDQFAQTHPTAAELRTVASALLLNFRFEEYEIRSAAKAMPAEKYEYRPAQGDYGGVYPGYGPKELRTFGEQVKHVACANFAFAAELDGKKPPPDCDKGGPSPAKTRDELTVYLHDSFKALENRLAQSRMKICFSPLKARTRVLTHGSDSQRFAFGTSPTTTARLCYTCASTESSRPPAGLIRQN